MTAPRLVPGPVQVWRIEQGTEGGMTQATIKVRVGEPCRIVSVDSVFGSTRNSATS
jgi:hypothetical protein